MSPEAPRSRLKDCSAGALLFLVLLAIYWKGALWSVSDSRYMVLLSETLLRDKTFALDAHVKPPLDPAEFPGPRHDGELPYQLARINGRIVYSYPNGTAVLSLPVVWLCNLSGRSVIGPDGRYRPEVEWRIQKIIACLLCAAFGALLFAIARQFLPPSPAWVAAFMAGICTPVFSSLSRAVWSDTWVVVLAAAALLLAVRAERGAPFHPLLAATLVSWAFFCRPTAAGPALALAGWTWLRRDRREFAWLAGAGAFWLLGFLVWSRTVLGEWLPSYYRQGLSPAALPAGLAAQWLSPSRGMLVFSPVLLVAGWLGVRAWRAHLQRPLLSLCAAAIASVALPTAAYPTWWGGHSYGPRLLAGLVPWLALPGIIGWASLGGAAGKARRIALAALLAAGALSAAIHYQGAHNLFTAFWNGRPQDIDAVPGRAWDWRAPQFLAGILPSRLPEEFPSAVGTVEAWSDDSEPYFHDGWWGSDGDRRWSASSTASLLLRRPAGPPGDARLRLWLEPLVVGAKIPRQRVRVFVNDAPVAEREFTSPDPVEWEILAPAAVLQVNNRIRFDLPDAVSPKKRHAGGDRRQLGIALTRFSFEPSSGGQPAP